MVTNNTTETSNRPYGPPSNVISVLKRLRSRNLPEQIDSEYLRDASISEGTIGRTLYALRFLRLINEAGFPTETLKSVHTSTDEEYQGILSGLIREAYSEVFNVIDPAEDSQDKILNIFRRYTPASQRDRMVVFFLGMCREAGIPTLDVPKARAMGVRKSAEIGMRATVKPVKGTQRRGGIEEPARINISPALEGLIKSLPAPGTPLSLERREQWLTMAEATLKFVYPKEQASDTKQGEEENDTKE